MNKEAFIKALLDAGVSEVDAEKAWTKNVANSEEIEIDAEAMKVLSASVVEGVTPTIEKTITSLFEKKAADEAAAKQAEVEATEGTTKKNVTAGAAPVDQEIKTMFFKAVQSLLRDDKEAVKAYNVKAMELREKAGYQNSDTNADGGYVVMLPEFEAEIERITPLYGIALRDATVRYINSNSIRTNKRGSNVTMYETGQGVQKTGTKITISQDTVTLRKFAGIAIVTDEMADDAAIDFWNEFTQDFAEEWARILDVLVFTDRVSSTYPGALYMPGINVETVGAAITSANWDDLANAEVKVPSADLNSGKAKWYMHKSVWNIIRLSKDNEGRYQALPSGVRQTPWGTTIELVDVMPSSSVVGDSNEPYGLFGDLSRVRLYIKKGLVLEKSNEATVHDSGGNAVNLWEKDMTAIRAVGRAVALVKFPEALAAIGTGTVS